MNTLATPMKRPITVAIFAMGGEGGGVLADWLIDMAEHSGYIAQLTSVPGVAQRTGATNYYLEMFPWPKDSTGPEPIMALIPMPGDIDVVVASELMEAGRAIQRGLVTPDRTTLIASTNRVFAMSEKMAMTDGRVDGKELVDACRDAARQFHAFDMAAMAEATGSVISAVLFGALAGSNALPFQRMAYEAAIRRGGVGIAPSLAAFTAGFETVVSPLPVPAPKAQTLPPPTLDGQNAVAGTQKTPVERKIPDALLAEVTTFPQQARSTIQHGLVRTADYQSFDYAKLYLKRLRDVAASDTQYGDGSFRLLQEAARQLALGMAYEDTIRVAELKIRPSRFERVRAEVSATDTQIVEIAEYMHPRTQEIADTLPAPLGRLILNNGAIRKLIDSMTTRGRTVKTSSLHGFLLLYLVASFKPMRPRSLRYDVEQKYLEQWLAKVLEVASQNYSLAVEVSATRNLVKGYGDTHERGRANYDRLIAALPALASRTDAAEKLAALRKTANADDSGAALVAALKESALIS
jgi:indolepyruvate ferredoxin oxidoreductase beta subunit